MKTLIKVIFVAILGISIAACGSDPKFDASSEKAVETSMLAMTKDLSAEDKEAFGAAFGKIMMKIAMESKGDEAKAEKKMKDMLDGKTVKEIIAAAK